MRITVYGAGYVGLVTGTCLAEMGNQVLCMDVNEARVAQLQAGICPIHEPDLPEMMQKNIDAGRLHFTHEVAAAIAHGELQFIAVGTPQADDGSANCESVFQVANAIGEHLAHEAFVIVKSTVPVGTCQAVEVCINTRLQERGLMPVPVSSNPEFLREGAAVSDFFNCDRIIIGTHDEKAKQRLSILYAPFNRNQDRLINMSVRSAELAKYAANAMLATKISFINEVSGICERLGADVEQVRIGIGSDPRIGYQFINPGCGFGGSCFPKDLSALRHMAMQADAETPLISAVMAVNETQKHKLYQKINYHFAGDLTGKRFALWGLAFKPNTDDIREAPSCVLIQELCAAGATVNAFDPCAMENVANYFTKQTGLQFYDSPEATLAGCDALIIVTEWPSFYSPDFSLIAKQLTQPVIFDGRNIYDPDYLKDLGFTYYAIGRGTTTHVPQGCE